MPRYCAVKLCKNRGGVPSKDNKKISFYPFPLRDEARLQQWVDNMKREEWTPSRHQYLCSDHFTEDSFDLRWGIRYLKHTAVPTIFPFIYEGSESPCIQDELSRLHSKKNSKSKAKESEINLNLIRHSSPPRKKALTFKKEGSKEEGGDGSVDGSTKSKGREHRLPSVLYLSDLDPNGPNSYEVVRAKVALPETGASIGSASEQPGDQRILITSYPSMPCETRAVGTVEVLCAGESAPLSSSEATQDRLQEAISQTISSLPLALQSRHTTENLESGPSNVEHNLLDEHSYSRQDTDKSQLWNKIASLHMKIMELEKREEGTVKKMNSLENMIAHLRKENIVYEEKQKALEDYFTSVFL